MPITFFLVSRLDRRYHAGSCTSSAAGTTRPLYNSTRHRRLGREVKES